MTEYELGIKAKEMQEKTKERDSVVQLILFGIKYADELRNAELDYDEILRVAGIKVSRRGDITFGIGLSKYVELK